MLGGLLSVLIGAAVAGQGNVKADDVTLQAAVQKEVVDGDLAGAIKQYEILAKSNNRPTAAKALLRMARCYEKLGDRQAVEVYQRIIDEFADQPAVFQQAAERIQALGNVQGNGRAVLPNGLVVGWYNGDWKQGVPGLANWFLSPEEFERAYDDFVVPDGGWTVAAVFSQNRMDFTGVAYAHWEIRRDMASAVGGKVVASGLSRATQTIVPGTGPFPRDTMTGYRIQVDGLHVQLAPGRYWLSVAPVGVGNSYVCATLGRNAIGNPPGNNGHAFYSSAYVDRPFVEAATAGPGGDLTGVGRDFSQGVIIAAPSR